MRRQSNPKLLSIISLTWVILITLGYLVTHYTSIAPFFNIVLPSLKSLLIVLLFNCLSGGIGNRLLSKWSDEGQYRFVVEVMIGFGVIALFTLLIGVIFHISTLIVAITTLAALIVFFRFILHWIKSIHTLFDFRNLFQAPFENTIIVFLMIVFLVQLIQAFSPAIKYDALMYHLTLPKTYLLNEKINDLPWLVMSGMPQTTEMLYLNVMALGGEAAALILNWMVGLLTATGLYFFLKRHLSYRSALVGTASLFSGFTLVSSLSWGYVDWFACFFGLGTILVMDSYFQKNDQQALFLGGLLAGLAFSTKYPAGVLFLAISLTLIINAKFSPRLFIPSVLRFSAGAAVFAFPWLIKNLVFTGNPFYPFFFASGVMNTTRIAVYQGAETYGDLFDLFLLPVRATIQGIEGTEGYSVSLGPLFLAFGIGAFIYWISIKTEHKSTIRWIGLLSLVGLVIWAVGNQLSGFLIQSRFYYSLFPAFAILVGFGYEYLSQNLKFSRIWQTGINILIFISLYLNLTQIGLELVQRQTLDFIAGNQDRQGYLEHNLGWYARAMAELNTAYSNSKVLMLYEPRGYECVPVCNPDEILDEWKVSYLNGSDRYQILAEWRKTGYTHLLVNSQGIQFLRDYPDPHHPVTELDALENLLETLPIENDYGGVYGLYKLTEN